MQSTIIKNHTVDDLHITVYETATACARTTNVELNRCEFMIRAVRIILHYCRAVLVDGPSFPLLCVARTDLGMPMDAILVTIQGSER